MKELSDKVLQVGDFVIPLITHTGKVVEKSLFAIVISSKEVFMYDERSKTYRNKTCSSCYKIEIDDNIKKNQFAILTKEYKNFVAQKKAALKNELLIGDVLYKEEISGIGYYIYLGKYRITMFNMNDEVLNHELYKLYTRYNYCYVKLDYLDNIILLDSLIEKGELVDLSDLVFGSIRHSLFNKNITDILYVKSSLLKGLYKYGHLYINGINNDSLSASNIYSSDVYQYVSDLSQYKYKIKKIEFDREK